LTRFLKIRSDLPVVPIGRTDDVISSLRAKQINPPLSYAAMDCFARNDGWIQSDYSELHDARFS
jgi:hypothetical protein